MSGVTQTLDPEHLDESLQAAEPFPLEDFSDCAQEAVPATASESGLNVRIELGRTALRPSEADALHSGTVVRLDELEGDPVSVYADGHLVARGDVLVLAGRLCVRITDISEPSAEVDRHQDRPTPV
jgi:flagellar motor switch protein FliN/FliY